MDIKRDKYLNDLINRMHNGMIKVVTGIRRCGKSYLLFNIFKNYLLEHGVTASHIITIELDQRKNKKYRDPDTILDYIESLIEDDEQYYIMLDEVQMLQEFEEVLNSLLHIRNADIYVTGSNSKFLSKDVITEFRGRSDEIHIYPLTFKEFMEAYDGDMYRGWAEYVVYGGLPLTVTMKTEEQKISYLTNLFKETYLKDIIERHHIEKTQELEDLVNILASAIGSLTNPPKIEATFKSAIQSTISLNTIRQYIEHLEDAFIINKANRYNVKGRKYIGTPLKYYFECGAGHHRPGQHPQRHHGRHEAGCGGAGHRAEPRPCGRQPHPGRAANSGAAGGQGRRHQRQHRRGIGAGQGQP